MAKTNVVQIKLVSSADTGFFYVTRKNARTQTGKLELKKEYVTLRSVVDVAVETARPLIESKRHTLSVTVPSEDITLEADPLRLAQVVANLLTNAAKYTDPGGRIALATCVVGAGSGRAGS